MMLEELKKILEEKEAAREELIKLSRDMRLNSSKAIAYIHAGNFEKAEKHLKKAEEVFERIKKFKEKFWDIYYLSFDAMQEFVEAIVFKNVVENLSLEVELPEGLEPAPILGGFADSIGEMRRYALTLLVKNNVEVAKKVLELMEELYFKLVEFTFHDKITGNLRPKLDVARNSIERTKSDLLSAIVAKKSDELLKKIS
ncbi:translin family protein [Ferroglobus placidus]|nr:translin [Ferroglobus placidus]